MLSMIGRGWKTAGVGVQKAREAMQCNIETHVFVYNYARAQLVYKLIFATYFRH
jgi:hypothetical protein